MCIMTAIPHKRGSVLGAVVSIPINPISRIDPDILFQNIK